MMAFAGFYKIAAVIQPSDRELERRSRERTKMFGKKIPKGALREMKANYSLPESSTFDAINYIELNEREAQTLVTRYNTCRR
uniref:Uncharacterized protein n=1 Tax=Arion vulgaris TaxID=1028688 RepID=A0A0B7A5N5_9EUPU